MDQLISMKRRRRKEGLYGQFVLILKTLSSSYLIVFPVIATCLWLSYIPFKPDCFYPKALIKIRKRHNFKMKTKIWKTLCRIIKKLALNYHKNVWTLPSTVATLSKKLSRWRIESNTYFHIVYLQITCLNCCTSCF